MKPPRHWYIGECIWIFHASLLLLVAFSVFLYGLAHQELSTAQNLQKLYSRNMMEFANIKEAMANLNASYNYISLNMKSIENRSQALDESVRRARDILENMQDFANTERKLRKAPTSQPAPYSERS